MPDILDTDQVKLGRFLKEGADKIKNTITHGARFASRAGDSGSRYDDVYWEIETAWHRNADVHVLVPRDPDNPAEAVSRIFDPGSRLVGSIYVPRRPEHLWRFDCSQFAQVVSFYAWMKLLEGITPGEFNRRVKASPSGKLQIKPFQGSTFTQRRLYYWRDSAKDPMKLYDYRDNEPWATEVVATVDQIVASAPIGSRVGFRNERGKDNFVAEQTVKVGPNSYLAHGLGAGPLSRDQVIQNLYRQNDDHASASLAEAKKYVWIRDVAYFLTLPD